MFPAPSRTPFRFPIPPDALAAFCHPHPLDLFHHPRRIGEHICAANGHVAIRCTRGHWQPEDYQGASDAYILRFSKLPWRTIPTKKEHWTMLDDARGTIYRRPPIAIFDSNHKLSPAPPVRIGKLVIVPLSIIQLVARLPRCEIYVDSFLVSDPIYFRFTGGEGIIANHRLFAAAFRILSPILNEDGTIAGKTIFPKDNPPRPIQPDPPIDGGPPVCED